MTCKKILIAVDASEFSMNAAGKGSELARQLNAQAAFVFVIDTSKAMGNVDAGITPDEALSILKKEAEETLDQLAREYDRPDLIRFMPEGHPKTDVLRIAGEWNADMIVVGTHGRTGLLSLLMGSTAEAVIHRSKIPVMVVPLRRD